MLIGMKSNMPLSEMLWLLYYTQTTNDDLMVLAQMAHKKEKRNEHTDRG